MSSLASTPLRVAIVGAGAIGLDLGAALLDTDAHVALLARGENLEALHTHGLEVHTLDGASRHFEPTRYRCADAAHAFGIQDVVFLTLKSGSIDPLWPALAPLIGPKTTLVSAMNGLPRWLAHQRPAITRHLPASPPPPPYFPGTAPDQLLAAVVHRNAARPRPGVVKRLGAGGMILGALDGQLSPRLRTLAQFDRDTYSFGLSAHIHRELWHKLMINAAFNPLSVVCERPLDEMVTSPILRARLEAVLAEVQALGCALELVEADSFDTASCFDHFARARKGASTSMLRDYRRAQILELDRLVRAPLWLAARPSLALAMPALAQLLSEVEDKVGPLARAQTPPTM